MKIIFLEAVIDHGGARKSTIELAKRISALGHDVLIVDFWGGCTPFVDDVNKAKIALKILDKRDKPLVIQNKSKIKLVRNVFMHYFLENQYKKLFSKIAKDFQADVVNVNNIKCLRILDTKDSYKIDYLARGWFEYKNLSLYAKKILKKYKLRFLTVSQSTRQAIFTGGIAEFKNIQVLTDVINTKVFDGYEPTYKPFGDENPIKILFSGGFLKTKGQHVCVEIAKNLKEKNIPFKMCLTGIIYAGSDSEKYYHHILNLIDRYELKSNVEVILNPPNIMDYFKNTDILIHPSYTEGLPRVALEALAFGKPIIANPVGGVTDVVIHNLTGFITDFNAVNQYIEYISIYSTNQEVYKKHSLAARQLISQNYLDNHQIKSLERIYPISEQ